MGISNMKQIKYYCFDLYLFSNLEFFFFKHAIISLNVNYKWDILLSKLTKVT